MKKIISLLFFNTLLNICFSQNVDKLVVKFNPLFKGESITINREEKQPSSDNFEISKLKFYVSNVRLYDNDSIIYTCSKNAHLIDASDLNSMEFFENIPKNIDYSSFSFDLGIDSLTSISGVMGGDLDPMKGMYWTWKSGYINFKLEGKHPQSPAKNNNFVFHIGGYQYPFNTLKTIEIDAQSAKPVEIIIDLDLLFELIDFEKYHNVMSPNQNAMEVAQFLQQIFYSRQ